MSGSETEPLLLSPLLIFFTCSKPSTTLPNTVYSLSKKGAASKHIKNCEFALFGLPDLAIERVPLSWGTLLNSAIKSGRSDPPVPAFLKSKLLALDLCKLTFNDIKKVKF